MDNRSKEAIIAENFLREFGRKDLLADWDFMKELVGQCEYINDIPYEVPEIRMIGAEELADYRQPLSMPMEKRIIHGVETFLINAKKERECPVTVMYFHGGGYVFQAKYEHIEMAHSLAEGADCRLIFPVYPMAPKYPHQDSYRTMIKYYRSFLKDTDPASIIFMGDSAGGGMALSLCMQLRDLGIPMPASLVLISPALDAAMNNPVIEERDLQNIDPMLTHSFYLSSTAWAGGEPLDHPHVSPMYGDLKGLPPITLYVGTREMLWPDAEKFCRLAAEQGVEVDYREWPGMNHCFCIYPIPEAWESRREMVGMIRALGDELKRGECS